MVTSDYRYERKFVTSELSKYHVESIVKTHPAIFSEIYQLRNVNNMYFDSFRLVNYSDNVDGSSDRIKIRIRWYGELFGKIKNPVLEIKEKKGMLGRKISIPISPFTLLNNTDIRDIIKSLDHFRDVVLIDFKSLIPTLLNRYSRKYYQSYDKNFRITIDDKQEFYSIGTKNNLFLEKYRDDNSVIIELKYDRDFEKRANNITSCFPFRVSKNSKYVNGLDKIYQ
jgi:hypothetical protein|tara:strand:+ start:365 stop:1039 length:675 start_codon:yes stop_codon:yes gene_type:complete